MPHVKIERIGTGQRPAEIIVGVCRADGRTEEVIVDRRSLDGDTLEVGFPVGWRAKTYCSSNFPANRRRGRVWVKAEDVLRLAGWRLAATDGFIRRQRPGVAEWPAPGFR